jgi:uncharacterized membrane protein YgcG
MAGRVGRVLGLLITSAVVLVLLLWPVAWAWLEQADSGPADDPVSITDYDAIFSVDSDGMLLATERIVAEFPGGRHGIFRYWDLADPVDPSVRYQPTVVSITRDGRPERYELSWGSGYRFLVARIGNADTFLGPGSHTYALTYRIPGTISPGATSADAPFVTTTGADPALPGSAFLWSVVASGWELSMARAGATLQLPAHAGRVQCATDPWGTPGSCTVEGAGTPTVHVEAAPLDPRTGMIVRAAMQPPAPARAHLPWSVLWDPVLGRTPWVTVGLLLASAVGAGLAALAVRRAREEPPGFPVQYEPPRGLGPVQAVYLDSEGVGPAPLVASVLHLAERGLVRLERPTADTWRIWNAASPQQWATVDDVTRAVAARLGIDGPVWFEADGSVEAGKVLQAADEAIRPAVQEWSQKSGLMARSPGERRAKALWFVLAGLSLLLFLLPVILSAAGSRAVVPTLVGLPAAAFVLAGMGLVSREVGQRRTLAGRDSWSRAGGFRRLLSTPSSEERFDFAARSDSFIAYLPYAVAFGVADAWAEKYRTEMGAEPPVPVWFPLYGHQAVAGFYSSGEFGSFSSSVKESIGAYTASQSSSSSGGGGGSFGGGGGGGGGSW